MARGMPSVMALLGLLAVAGYKNRDRLSDMLKDALEKDAPEDQRQGEGGILSEIQNIFSGGAAGGALAGGLGGLLDRFKNAGDGDKADSWVAQGPNKELRAEELERVIGAETLDELSKKTGLSREALLSRLAANIPAAVDRFTPDGRVPSEQEAARFI